MRENNFRKIAFRAWDKENNLMLFSMKAEGELQFGYSPDSTKTVVTSWFNPNLYIMQYTGLKDKNGNEIYEGDIVKGDEGLEVVKWKSFFNYSGDYQVSGFTINNSNFPYDTEVVGNIYENPELITNQD